MLSLSLISSTFQQNREGNERGEEHLHLVLQARATPLAAASRREWLGFHVFFTYACDAARGKTSRIPACLKPWQGKEPRARPGLRGEGSPPHPLGWRAGSSDGGRARTLA